MEVDPNTIIGVIKLGIGVGAVAIYIIFVITMTIIGIINKNQKDKKRQKLIEEIKEFDLKKNSAKDLKIFILSKL